jgi:hypothetical protein
MTAPEAPLAWASVHHGFTRGPGAVAGVSAVLARIGIASVRPAIAGLRPRRSIHDADYLRAGALERHRAATRRWGALPWLGVGHSAGAASALVEAAARVGAGLPVAGVICLDGTDTAGGVAAGVLAQIRTIPVRCLGAPPSRCNAGARLPARLLADLDDVEVLQIPGAGHGDAERIGCDQPSAGEHPALLYRVACGDSSGPGQVRELADALATRALDLVTRLHKPHPSQ